MRQVVQAGAFLGLSVALAAFIRPSRARAAATPAYPPPPEPLTPETERAPRTAETTAPRSTSTTRAPTPAAPAPAATYGATPAVPRDANYPRRFNQIRLYGEDTFRTPGDDIRVQLAPGSVGYRWMKEVLAGIDIGSMKAWRMVRSERRADGLYVGEYTAIADAGRGSAYVTDNQIARALRALSARFSNALLQTTRP